MTLVSMRSPDEPSETFPQMSTSRPLGEPISERFPLLWKSDDTTDDVRADLRLTDIGLGTRYRRGKQTRLDRYQQLEDALALRDALNYQATTEPILEVLRELMGEAPTLLDGLVPVVRVMKEDPQPAIHRSVVDLCDRYPDGTVAVIAEEAAELQQGLLEAGWQRTAERYTFGDDDGRKVGVYEPTMARGLEFDGVVIVEPADFPENPGKHDWLYTAVTRATKECRLVRHQPHQVEGASQFGPSNTPPSNPDPGDRVTDVTVAHDEAVNKDYSPHIDYFTHDDAGIVEGGSFAAALKGSMVEPAFDLVEVTPEEWRTPDSFGDTADSRFLTHWTGVELPEVRYIFSTIEHGAPVAMGAHRLDAVLTVMSGLDLDPTSVDLFREVICCLEPPSSLAAVASARQITRQATSVRRKRLARRLVRTRRESAIAALEEVVHRRLEAVTGRPAGDPFLSIALLTPDRKFPNVVDVVRLGLWLASGEGHGEVPVGFVLNDEGELIPR